MVLLEPRLAWNSRISCISLPKSWDYRCVSLPPAQKCYFSCDFILSFKEKSLPSKKKHPSPNHTSPTLVYVSLGLFKIITPHEK
jgi:hypothetical protein